MPQTRGPSAIPLAFGADVTTIDPRQAPAPPFTRREAYRVQSLSSVTLKTLYPKKCTATSEIMK